MALFTNSLISCSLIPYSYVNSQHSSSLPAHHLLRSSTSLSKRCRLCFSQRSSLPRHVSVTNNGTARTETYTVGDFMTRKKDLHVVKTTTTVDEALEAMVEKKLSGFPVVDEDWTLVGVVSDYDLLALNSISGGKQSGNNLFPNADSSWKTFNEMQKLLTKNNGKIVGDLMTSTPLVISETTNLEDAARLLLDTKYHRLPVVDAEGKLVGMIARENVVRAALQIKRAGEN
ncbi:CBS domain-containing protein CBSX1, chloroplastic-like [Mercurialis annua]|uniref:CBS domain-containing protein CBSX1, chloroplastic-like n=1 Tax=Mercurialis annua TaxID=3986 RepID=UPI0021600A97|nr:CBS domain-containing protein CBSX1, chloroplastic-like [Mercurialis annua]